MNLKNKILVVLFAVFSQAQLFTSIAYAFDNCPNGGKEYEEHELADFGEATLTYEEPYNYTSGTYPAEAHNSVLKVTISSSIVTLAEETENNCGVNAECVLVSAESGRL